VCALHAFLFVLLVLEAFEVECLVEVLGGYFVPALVRVYLLDPLQVVDLGSCFLFEELADLSAVHF
jgi:hypothetical protein